MLGCSGGEAVLSLELFHRLFPKFCLDMKEVICQIISSTLSDYRRAYGSWRCRASRSRLVTMDGADWASPVAAKVQQPGVNRLWPCVCLPSVRRRRGLDHRSGREGERVRTEGPTNRLQGRSAVRSADCALPVAAGKMIQIAGSNHSALAMRWRRGCSGLPRHDALGRLHLVLTPE